MFIRSQLLLGVHSRDIRKSRRFSRVGKPFYSVYVAIVQRQSKSSRARDKVFGTFVFCR